MTSKDFNTVVLFTFTLGLWYCIGYLQGYDAGEKWGRQAGREEAIVAATAPSDN